MVSSGTSSSAHRNQQAGPGSASITVATIDTSRPCDSRGSETSNLVSNKECGTGIATEGVDFLALLTLGRNFGVSQSSFG